MRMSTVVALRAAIALAVLILAFLALLWVSRSLSTGRWRAAERPPPATPLEVLRRRYAAGEIDEDEYLRRLSGRTPR